MENSIPYQRHFKKKKKNVPFPFTTHSHGHKRKEVAFKAVDYTTQLYFLSFCHSEGEQISQLEHNLIYVLRNKSNVSKEVTVERILEW